MNNNNLPYLTVSVALIIASIALFYFLVIPQFEKISAQEKEISDLEFKLENTTNYFNDVALNAKELEELGWDDLSKKIDANFMDGPFFIHNMEAYLNKLVVRSGLHLNSLDIEGVSESFEVKEGMEDSGTLTDISISFDLSGDYNYFLNLLDIFDKQALVIKIDNIEISGINTDSSSQNQEESGDIIDSTYLNFKIKGSVPSKK
ncbi:MAG: hypothetical protein PHG24_00905 [Candidatus Pacebacteria bacterium]|nr:hypothetical protein [Candidatus Paceibacterota bacterium]